MGIKLSSSKGVMSAYLGDFRVFFWVLAKFLALQHQERANQADMDNLLVPKSSDCSKDIKSGIQIKIFEESTSRTKLQKGTELDGFVCLRLYSSHVMCKSMTFS